MVGRFPVAVPARRLLTRKHAESAAPAGLFTSLHSSYLPADYPFAMVSVAADRIRSRIVVSWILEASS